MWGTPSMSRPSLLMSLTIPTMVVHGLVGSRLNRTRRPRGPPTALRGEADEELPQRTRRARGHEVRISGAVGSGLPPSCLTPDRVDRETCGWRILQGP